MKPGVRVIRGPDWKYGDEDGGVGYLGTIINIYPNNSVKVRWDVGTETVCRAGLDGAYDLRMYDNSPLGTKQAFCDGKCLDTNDANIYGIRWKCLVCEDRDNCTLCYMSGYCTQCIDHPFARYLTPNSTVVRVPPRRGCKRKSLLGIFPGAHVTKVITSSNSQDNEKVGIVKELIDLQPDAYRSAVRVEWIGVPPKKNESGEPEYPIYRIGADGKVELKVTQPVSPGKVVIDHLPVLDMTMPMDVELNEGDKVRIDQNFDTYKHLLGEFGGWVPDMEKVLGEEGVITKVKDTNRRIVSVKYSHGTVKAMYMNVLTKISAISAGDIVRVIKDETKMKKLQSGHGGWRDTFVSILGEQGRVLRIDDSKDAIIEIQKYTFVLNPDCLVFVRHDDTPIIPSEKERKAAVRRTVPKSARRMFRPGYSVDIGVRVVRGPDWSPDFDDQDGGEGSLGTVTEICGVQDHDTYPKDCVVVVWDNGEKNVYRTGYEKSFDLRIFDNSTIGVKHNLRCSECAADTIYGLLWICTVCEDVNLCSECYNNDKHDISHVFERFDSADCSQGTRVPKRNMSKRIPARGIFEGCKVRRGPDWRWHDQDGGVDKFGDVIALVNFSPDTDRDAAEVTWGNGYTNVYRLGYHGRLDIVAVDAIKGQSYYRDHIPILKLQSEAKDSGKPVSEPTKPKVDKPAAVNGTDSKEAARFWEGDKVKITIDVDVLKMIEENRGAWNDHMAECIGRSGTVIMSKDSDITVDFEVAGRWTFHESVLNKVRQFVTGEVVKVIDSVDHVRMLQTDDAGWNDNMTKVIGKKGLVEEIDEEGDIRISFGEYTWVMNPECLTPSTGPPDIIYVNDPKPEPKAVPPPVAAAADPEVDLLAKIESGDRDGVRTIITREAHLLLMDLKGKFAIHQACVFGQVEIIQDMFKTASKEALIELEDSEKITPLLAAVRGGHVETVEYLVGEGANKAAVNTNQQGAVHIAVSTKQGDNKLHMLKTLQTLGFNVNQQDALSQSPVFDAILNGTAPEVEVILGWPGLDVDIEDTIGFTPFFIACRKGSIQAVEGILKLRPRELQERKQHDDYTGLHLAAMNGNSDVVEFLVQQKDIKIDAQTSQGKTPLHLACEEANINIVKILIRAGADCQMMDFAKKNCLHLCFEAATDDEDMVKVGEGEDGRGEKDEAVKELARVLLEQGVPANDVDDDEKKPADYLEGSSLAQEFNKLMASVTDGRESQTPARRKPAETGPPSSMPVNFSRTERPIKSGESVADAGPRSLRITPKKGDTDVVQKNAKTDPIDKRPKIEPPITKQQSPSFSTQDERRKSATAGRGRSPVARRKLIIGQEEDSDGEVEEEPTTPVDPELCASCEEEPNRYRLEPCKHLLCGDCIPTKKQKKKLCAVCGKVVQEVTELHHQ